MKKVFATLMIAAMAACGEGGGGSMPKQGVAATYKCGDNEVSMTFNGNDATLVMGMIRAELTLADSSNGAKSYSAKPGYFNYGFALYDDGRKSLFKFGGEFPCADPAK